MSYLLIIIQLLSKNMIDQSNQIVAHVKKIGLPINNRSHLNFIHKIQKMTLGERRPHEREHH